MQKAAEDLKKKQEEEAAAKKLIIEKRVPPLKIDGMDKCRCSLSNFCINASLLKKKDIEYRI